MRTGGNERSYKLHGKCIVIICIVLGVVIGWMVISSKRKNYTKLHHEFNQLKALVEGYHK